MSAEEQWRSVIGFEGSYEVSDQGRVRSVERTVVDSIGRPRKLAGGPVKGVKNPKSGYVYVSLSNGRVSQARKPIHVLVLESFVGPRPDGMEVRHYPDPDPENNRLSNLSWSTHLENMRDIAEHGTHNNTRKTRCKREHEFTPINTRVDSKGHRYCRACKAIREGRSPDRYLTEGAAK